jgi:hypothetical protein
LLLLRSLHQQLLMHEQASLDLLLDCCRLLVSARLSAAVRCIQQLYDLSEMSQSQKELREGLQQKLVQQLGIRLEFSTTGSIVNDKFVSKRLDLILKSQKLQNNLTLFSLKNTNHHQGRDAALVSGDGSNQTLANMTSEAITYL